MKTANPKVFSIPPGAAFLEVLAAGLLARFGEGDPFSLSDVTVLVPNRRAVRGLGEAFLRAGRGQPLLLPAIWPIGDMEDEAAMLAGPGGPVGETEIPPEIGEFERLFLLARLIMSRGDGPDNIVQAVALARELARLLDQVHREQLSFDGLASLVPEDYARHWQKTLEFLTILTEHWPRILAESGKIDRMDRRNRLLAAQVGRWRHTPPAGPVIAAGSTGSIPATAELLALIARLPQGEVVLPGFEGAMARETWDALVPSHPQYGMKQLLERIGVDRNEVGPWHGQNPGQAPSPRERLIATALLPAAVTDKWLDQGPVDARALAGMTFLEVPGPREEAGAIALIMRQTLEHKDRTAALVTPDRGLARRVAADLRRWHIEVDDSAGTPLGLTPAGAFLRLTAVLAAEQAAPVALLSVLKHPLASGGMDRAKFRALVRGLERRVLRGPRPAKGMESVVEMLKAKPADQHLHRWFAGLARQARPFLELMSQDAVSLNDLLESHLGFAETLASTESGPGGLWAGEAGEEAARLITDLREGGRHLSAIEPKSYPGLLATLMASRAVRPRFGRHPRLFIWGPLEARLQQADRLILGGLNEGTWPPEAETDPWLSLPMRDRFGLPPADRRVGQSAHDFAQGAAAAEVFLTRSEKTGGGPTVPSRWLLRLQAVIGEEHTHRLRVANPWLAWHQAMDRPARIQPLPPPTPRPPVALRPRRLSVTEIERWVRDPYAIYAKHILKLEPLQPLDADPGAADRGTMIHRALEVFLKANPGTLAEDARDRLLAAGEEAFGDALLRPAVWAFWWSRFQRIAGWFVEQERERREKTLPAKVEIRGRITLSGPAGPFELRAKADRIEELREGGLAIVDYKTGAVPEKKIMLAGLAPQLPLEAAMAQRGGFEGIDAMPVRELAYWRLSGGTPPGVITTYSAEQVKALEQDAWAGLSRLIEAFDRPETAYRSRPRPEYAGYGDYDHLARVKEWRGNE